MSSSVRMSKATLVNMYAALTLDKNLLESYTRADGMEGPNEVPWIDF